MMFRRLNCLLWFAALMPSVCCGQMVVDGYGQDKHDRFAPGTAGSDFIGDGFDLSGVSRDQQNTGRWVTMISPTHFLSSNHAAAGGTVEFYLENDASGPTIECEIESGRQVADSDVWLGTVVPGAQCDTSLVRHYPIARPDDYAGQTVIGVGRSGNRSTRALSIRLGLNTVDYAATTEAFRGDGDLVFYIDDSAAGDVFNEEPVNGPGLIEHEFRFSNGDSGGPTFIVNDEGKLELFGIHSYLAYDGESILDNDTPPPSAPSATDTDEMEEEEETPPPLLASRWASVDTYLPTIRNDILAEVIWDLPNYEVEFDEDVQPVGTPADNEFYIVQSTLDCDLDYDVDFDDINCVDWVGSLADFDLLLEVLNLVEGDFDFDGEVGFSDFLIIARNYELTDVAYADGDFDRDGTVGFSDFLSMSGNFGMVSPEEEDSQVAGVPEPASATAAKLMLIIIAAGFRRRRHQT